jgi:hypothetical protein
MRKIQSVLPVALSLALVACGHGAANLNAQAAEPPAAASPAAAAPEPAEMDIARMKLAKQVGKQSVPVDVRYEVSGAVAKDGSTAVQLAFIPRVEGTAMRVEFPRSESVSISETEELSVQKASAASVHRHNLVVTPLKGDTGEVRAVVSMEVAGGRYFGIFVIPVASAAP